MDSQYNVEATQHTTTTSSSTDIGLDKIYLTSIDSILKIVEMVLSLIVFICITSHAWYSVVGGGWVQFVSISCLITVLILWIFFMLRIIYKLPGPWALIILIYYIVYTVFFLICFLVCAIQASKYYDNGGLIAAAIFSFIMLGVLAVDTFFQFRKFREGQSRPAGSSSGGSTTVTTSHTTYETRTQY